MSAKCDLQHLPDQVTNFDSLDDKRWLQVHSPTDSVHTADSEASTLWSPTTKASFEDKKTEDHHWDSSRASDDGYLQGTLDNRCPPALSSTSVTEEESQKSPPKRKTPSWRELPRKGQLALLMVARLPEPLTQTSLKSYMSYQLK